MIVVDDATNILWPNDWSGRCIGVNLATQHVNGIVFSSDGRWLYAAEHSWSDRGRKRILSTSISRADVHAHFAKPMETSKINRLTGQPGGFYSPTPMTRVAVLPEGVAISVVEVSPDGRIIAAGTPTGDTHLIRVRGGETLGVLKRKRGKRTDDQRVRRLAFSPSGKQLGVVLDGMLRVWDVKTATSLWDVEDAKANAIDLSYHPDGNTIAVARSDGAAVFLDAQSGKLQKRYDWKVGQLNSIAFSPDGLTCAAGGEKGQVIVWDVDS
jgi:WD40 repeat protein